MVPNYQMYQQPVPQQFNGYYGNTANMVQQPMYQRPVTPIQQAVTQLPGRIVNNFNDIQPGEVQMDGSRAYFPTSDESTIFVKFWNSDGKLDHKKYVLVQNDEPIEEKPDILETINSRFDKLEQLMSNRQNFKSNQRKED